MWFDLETKMRHIVQTLCGPMFDRVHTQKDEIDQLTKFRENMDERVELLENLVMNKDEKIDAFEKINERMMAVETFSKQECLKVQHNIDLFKQTHEQFEFDFKNHSQHMRTLDEHVEKSLKELDSLKMSTQ
jgi:hypothetical protein